MQMEAHAIASFYKDLFGDGDVPAAYKEFLKVPEPPEGDWQHGADGEDSDEGDAGAGDADGGDGSAEGEDDDAAGADDEA